MVISEEHGGRIVTVRKLSKELNKNIAILLDTKGPEIRTGDFCRWKNRIQKRTNYCYYY